MKKIRVLCVDDHQFLRKGIRAALKETSDLMFAGELATAEGLVEAAAKCKADIVLLDIEMPGPDPFEALEDLRQSPKTKAIILSAYVRDHYVDAAVSAGAWGYLCKNDDSKAIVDAIRKVANGEFVLGPSVMGRCLADPKQSHYGAPVTGKPFSKLQTLSAREQQILRLIGKGMSRIEIAKWLTRSPRTVDGHRKSIMEKMDIHDRVELVRYAIREGLVEA